MLLTNLSNTALLTTPLSTILLSLRKSTGTVFNLSRSNLSTSNFKIAKSAF